MKNYNTAENKPKGKSKKANNNNNIKKKIRQAGRNKKRKRWLQKKFKKMRN